MLLNPSHAHHASSSSRESSQAPRRWHVLRKTVEDALTENVRGVDVISPGGSHRGVHHPPCPPGTSATASTKKATIPLAPSPFLTQQESTSSSALAPPGPPRRFSAPSTKCGGAGITGRGGTQRSRRVSMSTSGSICRGRQTRWSRRRRACGGWQFGIPCGTSHTTSPCRSP